MATILDFRAQDRPSGRSDRDAQLHPAEIVLFPGVRYERWNQAQKAPKRRGRRTRDTIELND